MYCSNSISDYEKAFARLFYQFYSFCLILFVEDFFLNDPELQDETPPSYLSHKELYEYAIRKSTIIFRKIKQLQEEGKDGVDNYL